MPSKVSSLATNAAADGTLSRKEADNLVKEAKRDGVITSQEKAEVHEALSHATPSTARVRTSIEEAFGVDAFSAPVMPPLPQTPAAVSLGPVADPKLFETDGSVTYAPTSGTAFVGGATASDVQQGQIGDCYVLAALIAYVEAHPGEIEKRVVDNHDGTFTINFTRGQWARNDATNHLEWKTSTMPVTVDADLPTRHGQLAYGRSKTNGELWVSLVEKAYAQAFAAQGGYSYTGKGGGSADVLRLLDGGQYKEAVPTESAAALSAVRAAVQSKQPITASSLEVGSALLTNSGIVPNHAYAIVGLSEANGDVRVTLQNPWGKFERGNDGVDEGRFTISWADFTKYFLRVQS